MLRYKTASDVFLDDIVISYHNHYHILDDINIYKSSCSIVIYLDQSNSNNISKRTKNYFWHGSKVRNIIHFKRIKILFDLS